MRRRGTIAAGILAAGITVGLAGPALTTEAGAGDDLQWLEAPTEAKARAWAQDATQRSEDKLKSLPSYAAALKELQDSNRSEPPVAEVGLLGRYAVRVAKSVDYPSGQLQTAEREAGGFGQWKTVLDIGALNTAEKANFQLRWFGGTECLAPEFRRCLLQLSPGGGDETALREFDLESAQFVKGGFDLPASRMTAAWLSQDAVLVGHSAKGALTTPSNWPAEIRVWKRGTPVDSGKSVMKAGPKDAFLLAQGLGGDGRALVMSVPDYSTFILYLVTEQGAIQRLDLPSKVKLPGFQAAVGRHVLVQIAEPVTIGGKTAPAESVVSYDLDAKEGAPNQIELVYAAIPGEVIADLSGFKTTRTRVILPIQSGLKTRLVAARHTGKAWELVPLTTGRSGVTLRTTGSDRTGEDLVIVEQGFLVPPSLHLFSGNGSQVAIESRKPAFDASGMSVEIKQARARDGEIIDYFLIGPASVKPGKPVATLMNGYGAFGLVRGPAYFNTLYGQAYGGATLKLWLERGGALVVPAIRGGGERGLQWHQAAMGERRQVSYDDYYAVAEELIRSGFTDRAHLGAVGFSNAGLLSAVAGIQRPDLFGAVIADAPLTDMLRYTKMGMGAAWTLEYGDPADPKVVEAIRRWSPIHNVKPGVSYPPFYVSVSTTDNRVGPGHGRKLAKRLMDVGSPTYFLEPDSGGHGAADPLKRPDVLAMQIAFLIDTLMRP